MKLILLGPPGSGKGTQAKKLAEKLSIPHISTGDIFRQNIANKTELGLKVKAIVDAGNLVPDELTDALVEDRLAEEDCKTGFILDGYPRNLHQGEALDGMVDIDYAINVQVSDEEVTKRLSGRRYCPECKKTYHVVFNPPAVEGKCDCGADLIIRDDDKPEVIQDRLNVYHEQTEPIIEYYQNKGNLLNVNGAQDIDLVLAEILQKLGVESPTSNP